MHVIMLFYKKDKSYLFDVKLYLNYVFVVCGGEARGNFPERTIKCLMD